MNDAMTMGVHGLHHVTAVAGDPQENMNFYTGVLGLRLVKRSVNQDAPDTYHLFFADGVGTPGTDLTFFPWSGMQPAQQGAGMVNEVAFAVPSGSLDYWRDRLAEAGIAVEDVERRFGEDALPFEDPHGLPLALVETVSERPFVPWTKSPVPEAQQIRGMHEVTLGVRERDFDLTEALLTQVLGFEKAGHEGDRHRYSVDDGASGQRVSVTTWPDGQIGRGGTGGVHHVAWRVHDEDEEQAVRERVAATGLRPSSPIDRFWFKSVYFREPGGILFELATDGPGFGRDEDLDHLGEQLILPPWLEGRREQIEAGLPPLELPTGQNPQEPSDA